MCNLPNPRLFGGESWTPQAPRSATFESHEAGFRQATVAELGPSKALVLQPWAAIEGTLQRSGQPARNERIRVKNEAARPEGCLVPSRETLTDSDGRFSFRHLVPAHRTVERVFRDGRAELTSHSRFVDLAPGEVLRLALGASGRLVIGRVRTEPAREVDWSDAVCLLHAQPKNTPTTGVQCIRMVEARGPDGRVVHRQVLEGNTDTILPHYSFVVQEDGSFAIEDLAPGEYVLSISLSSMGEAQGSRTGVLA